MNMNLDPASLKALVAAAAVGEVPDGCVLGVGTGSTVDCFIDALAAAKKPLHAAVASSERTRIRLEGHGYRVIELSEVDKPLALYVDGADEIDASLCMVKGGELRSPARKWLPVPRSALSALLTSQNALPHWAASHCPSR